MQPSTDELTFYIDREKIRDCLNRLARGEDRRDARLLRGAYWPDATDDHGIFQGTFEEYLDWVVPGSPLIPVTLHTLGQSLIELQGLTARVETHLTSYHRIDTGNGPARDLVIGVRYLDRMEKRGSEWRIAHRIMIYDWLRDWGESVDWSNGVLGTPFLSGHAIGSAHGDFSATFFEAG